jgi:lipopolysaccharide/colanic/teichoic acid biosynthesis glycosyltransferase
MHYLKVVELVVKRFADIFISISALLAFFPFGLLLIGILAVADPGPIFFRQERIGKDGKKFFIWKFRTMRVHQPSDGERHLWLKRSSNFHIWLLLRVHKNLPMNNNI